MMYEKEVAEFIKAQIKGAGDTLQDAAGYIGLRSRQALQDKLQLVFELGLVPNIHQGYFPLLENTI